MAILAQSVAPGGFDRRTTIRLAAGAAGLLVVLIVLTAAVWHDTGPTLLDHTPAAVQNRLNRLAPPLVFRRMVWLASPGMVVALAVALALLAARWRDWFGAALACVGPAIAVVLVEKVAKPLVGRHTTTDANNVFPSGHVTGAAAIAAVAVLLIYRRRGATSARRWALAAGCLPFAVTLGVVHLGWHFLTDAVGGLAFGTATVLATAAALSVLWPRVVAGDRR